MANDQTQDIRVLREPTVHLAGRQVVGGAGVGRFLADHGVSWQTDRGVAGEHLAEVAGRPGRMPRRKSARPAARSVPPDATQTKTFVTADARALRHLIEMRASRHAEVEIRGLAVKVPRIMKTQTPHLFADYRLEALPDGTSGATTQHRKV
jgi:hypothetical protein